jgi:hypothetical protein
MKPRSGEQVRSFVGTILFVLLIGMTLTCGDDTTGLDGDAECTVVPASLTFGATSVGGCSATQNFTITNTGGGELTGTIAESSPDFEITAGSGAYALASGDSKVVSVRFCPQSSGAKSCTVGVGGDKTVSCSGTAVGGSPACAVVPSSLSFEAADIGTYSTIQSFTLTNTGSGNLSGSISEDCPDFEITTGSGAYDLSSGASRTVSVRFHPQSAGSKSCTIVTGCSQDVVCTGSGNSEPVFSVDPTSLTFPGTVVGQCSVTQSFTITNAGGGTLRGSVAEDCSEFEITAGAGAYNLSAGQSLTVNVRFCPTSSGSKECVVGTGWDPSVSCAGTANDCGVSVSQTVLQFAVTEIGQCTAAQDFTITNVDCSGTLTGTVRENCADFEITSGAGAYSLNAGESRPVSVRFCPQSSGLKSCTIDTGNGSLEDVTCTAIGEAPPACTIQPISQDFGSVLIGDCSDAKEFTITNTGGGTLSGTIAGICGDFAILSGAGAYELGSGESVTVSVRYCPQSDGFDSCTIETGCSEDLTCTGTGIEEPPVCSIHPTSLDLGPATVGQCSAVKTFAIKNVGGGTLGGFVSESSPDFEITAGSGTYAIEAGDSLTVSIRFCPQTTGTKNATIDTGGSCSQDVGCTGSGAEPSEDCADNPTSLEFSSIEVGQCSATQDFTITNVGSGTLNGVVAESSPDFEITAGGGPYSLSAGETHTVSVRFCPQSSGPKRCTIDTGASCPQDVSCSGTGTPRPACFVNPTTLSFSNVAVGECTATKSFTITNIGGGTLTGSVVAECADFEITAGSGVYSLTTGQTQTISVRFCPKSVGLKNCEVATGCDVDVSCSATADPPPICTVNPIHLAFGTIAPGACTSAKSFSITNSGGGSLIGTVSIDSPDFMISAGGGSYSLGSGQARTVSVRFCPQSYGSKTCTVDTGCTQTVGCTGTGGDSPIDCTVSPTGLDFGSVDVGQCGTAQSFTITNTGGTTLAGVVSENSPDFEITSGAGAYSLGLGQSRVVLVRFCPVSSGTKSSVVDTGLDCARFVSLAGVGNTVPLCSVTPTRVSFENTVVGQCTASQSFTIMNVGGGTLTGSVAEYSSDFELTAGGGDYALTAGQSRTVRVRFCPQSAGPKSCTVYTGLFCAEDVDCSGMGVAGPECSVTPASLDFGATTVGQCTLAQSFTIMNTGSGTLSGTVSEDCPDFEITSGAGSYNLNAGQSRTVSVRFCPQSAGSKNCTVETGCAQDVACAGSGEAPVPGCSVSPTTLSFGTVLVGDCSAPQDFTITNTGSATLAGSVGESCADYEITSGSGAYSLAPGEVRTVSVRFCPQSLGSKNCTIDTGTACSQDVACGGLGDLPPSCAVSPTVLSFATTTVGQCSSTQNFTITNTGGGALSGTVSEACPDYEITSGSGVYNLTAGQARTVTVRFCPQSAGDRNCTIDTGTGCAQDVGCSGIGELPAACTVSPTTLSFGSTIVGQCTSTQNFTITNSGGGTLTGSVSESCPDFEITSGAGAYSLAAGQSRTVSVRFCPQSLGGKNCSIDTGCTQSVTGTGTGQDCVSFVTPTALDFGTMTVGQCTATQEFTITNQSCATLSGTVSESCPDFEITAGSGAYNLAAGQTRTVTVRFCPQSPGAKNCTIETGNAGLADVGCSGTGEAPPNCQVSPGTLTFATTTVGQCTSTQNFTITNTGGGTLNGTVSETCPDFEITSGSGSYSLTTGQSRTVSVRFCPQSAGAKDCTIDTGTSCMQDVVCSGTGEMPPACTVSPTTLSFGAYPVGQCTVTQNFTITNTGGGTLSGSVSEACADFEITSGSGEYNLTAGQSRTVSVRFCPQSGGPKNCTIDTGTPCAQDVTCTGTGDPVPVCTVSPTSLSFPTTPIGQCSVTQDFTITNTGGQTLSGVVSENCADFEITAGSGAYSLAAGQSRTVSVRFCPQSAGAKNCTVDTGTPCVQDVTCTGTGEIPATCAVSPTTLTFGTIQVGQCSVTQDFTITNTGGGTLSGTVSENCPDFEITAGSGTYNLPAGQSRTVSVRFCPQSAGAKNCAIDTGCSQGVSCTGTGDPLPVCTVSPTTLSFGTYPVGQCTTTQNFTITNTGGGTLSGSVSESCTDFEITSGSGSYSLTAGQSRTVSVRFCPQSGGLKNCTIDTGTPCTQDVACTGTGDPAAVCTVSPTSLSFGTIQVGQCSGTQDFTITNTGGQTLSGTVSESCTDFEITSGSGAYSLAAGQSRTVSVRFCPQSAGAKNCPVDTGTPCTQDVTCTGTGDPAPVCTVSPTTLSFGTYPVGQCTTTQNFTITNTGGGTLSGSVSESCTDFEITSGSGSYSLTAGQSRTVSVRFCPQSGGLKNCTIDTGTPCTQDVACTGTGDPAAVCTVSPTSLSFGSCTVNDCTNAQNFTITNTGGQTLSGTVSESCGDFEITSGAGAYSLTAGQSRTVSVRFCPQSAGAKNCTVDTGTQCTQDVSCTGTGELPPNCQVSPTTLTFATTTVGQCTTTQNFTITNTGGGTLSGSVSESCADFEITSGSGSYSLTAGQSRTVSVRFCPQSGGPKVCTIETGTNCTQDVSCSGSGQETAYMRFWITSSTSWSMTTNIPSQYWNVNLRYDNDTHPVSLTGYGCEHTWVLDCDATITSDAEYWLENMYVPSSVTGIRVEVEALNESGTYMQLQVSQGGSDTNACDGFANPDYLYCKWFTGTDGGNVCGNQLTKPGYTNLIKIGGSTGMGSNRVWYSETKLIFDGWLVVPPSEPFTVDELQMTQVDDGD